MRPCVIWLVLVGCGPGGPNQMPPAVDDARAVDAAGDTVGDAADPVAPPWRIVGDASGIQRLERYGSDLFAGVGGYYIIGSCTGADDANNVTSQGSDGQTLSSPGSCPGAPFSLAITGDNPYRVAISIGPLPVSYRTLSVPLDPRKDLFDRFAFDGNAYQVGCGTSYSPRTGSGAAFDAIPRPCNIPGVGPVGVARVVPVPPYGEIVGPLGTIRRRILGGNAEELAFINHPGTNNIEVSFTDNFAQTFPAGTIVVLEEELELIEPPIIPPITHHEVESASFGHAIGRAEADGWSADTNVDPPGFLAFGPYISLGKGHYEADFRLMVDNHTADNLVVVRIEATDAMSGTVLAKRDVGRMEFGAAGVYQDFTLAFDSPGGDRRIELRTFWHDRSYVRQDAVVLRWPQ